MKIKVVEKRSGLPRRLSCIYFDDEGEIDYIETRDPDTGHDPANHLFEDLIWDIDIEDEDVDKFKLCIKDKEEDDTIGQND